MIRVTEKEYVTYLRYTSGEFDPNKISTDISLDRVHGNKPDKAWWGSPVYAEYDWKKWCKDHDVKYVNFDKPITWKLEEGSKVYFINAEDVVLEEDNPTWESVIPNNDIQLEPLAYHTGNLVDNKYYIIGGSNVFLRQSPNIYIYDLKRNYLEKIRMEKTDDLICYLSMHTQIIIQKGMKLFYLVDIQMEIC